jgi:hypothetical protein
MDIIVRQAIQTELQPNTNSQDGFYLAESSKLLIFSLIEHRKLPS